MSIEIYNQNTIFAIYPSLSLFIQAAGVGFREIFLYPTEHNMQPQASK